MASVAVDRPNVDFLAVVEIRFVLLAEGLLADGWLVEERVPVPIKGFEDARQRCGHTAVHCRNSTTRRKTSGCGYLFAYMPDVTVKADLHALLVPPKPSIAKGRTRCCQCRDDLISELTGGL